MSPHNVNNFVTDLVAMAKAMEEVPVLRKEIEAKEHTIIQRDADIIGLQDDLKQARSYASTLEQKVHDLEVAKDQAETMFLESDDRFTLALDFIKTTFGNAGALVQALEPPKVKIEYEATPEPKAGDPSPVAESTDLGHGNPQGQSESPLPDTNASTEKDGSTGSVPETAITSDVASTAGQSDPLPSPAPSPAEPNASTPSADGPDDAKSLGEPEPRYFDYDGSGDDVGYHNEPLWHSSEHHGWTERMDRKYGPGNWPRRVENSFYRS